MKMNKYGWLAVTLVGTAISLYGNHKVQQEVKKEQERMSLPMISAEVEHGRNGAARMGVTEDTEGFTA